MAGAILVRCRICNSSFKVEPEDAKRKHVCDTCRNRARVKPALQNVSLMGMLGPEPLSEPTDALMGHARISTTERYLHSNDKLKQAAVDSLAAFSGAGSTTTTIQQGSETGVTGSRINSRARSSAG